MGIIVPFTGHAAACCDALADLETPECLLLIASRWWASDWRTGADPLPRLRRGMERADAPAAAYSVNALMQVAARTATRPLDIRCPRCSQVSDDEARLLRAAGLAQQGQGELAERVLRTAFLSAQGAEFAVGPLEGLGRLFCRGGLSVPERGPRRSHSAGCGALRGMAPAGWKATLIAGARMQRHYSVGVAELVALMAADRLADARDGQVRATRNPAGIGQIARHPHERPLTLPSGRLLSLSAGKPPVNIFLDIGSADN